ncbi:MAG TPA: catalase, partial [Thermodesulfobacteriota bacterium]|nr:catalase [Thermodesulfobacteriota bacterium]
MKSKKPIQTRKAAARKGPTGGSTGKGRARATIGGPAAPLAGAGDPLVEKMEETQELAESMPNNDNKAKEYGKAAYRTPVGETAEAERPLATASTLSEVNASEKAGSGEPKFGFNANNLPLDRVRVDSTGRKLTTNQGVPVADNQHSLKAGLRGPALLEDFILREKITHFDHERIPERVVHARGSGAHGYFECYQSQEKITRMSIFAEAGKRTPVFVRF